MKQNLSLILLLSLLLSACIGDDIIFDTVPETLRITNAIDTLAVGDTHQLEARYTNNIGEIEAPTIQWSSANNEILTVTSDGAVTGISKGSSQIFAEVLLADNASISDTLNIEVADTTTFVEVATSRTGMVKTTTFYDLEGDFEITQDGDDLIITFADNYEASRSLPGLYVYMTNNPNTTNGALEIGKVEVFQGAHSYTVEDVDLKDFDYLLYYCKPFNVKVGDGKID